jgi:hypothetical protein
MEKIMCSLQIAVNKYHPMKMGPGVYLNYELKNVDRQWFLVTYC